jgi:formylglycine-generating enzyme required for sulfatase activity
MYYLCVQAGVCKEPTNTRSYTHDTYYGNAKFDNYPVIYVNWNMAKTYCEWVDRRLPIEAEWEKAARGTDANIYPWGNEAPNPNLLNYNSNIGDTSEVGKYSDGKSIFGALDMAGNVWEWVSSLYQPYPYKAEDGRENLNSSEARVFRGGSWVYFDYDVRSANRGGYDPSNTDDTFGFRCAASQNMQLDATPPMQTSTVTLTPIFIHSPTSTNTPAAPTFAPFPSVTTTPTP